MVYFGDLIVLGAQAESLRRVAELIEKKRKDLHYFAETIVDACEKLEVLAQDPLLRKEVREALRRVIMPAVWDVAIEAGEDVRDPEPEY